MLNIKNPETHRLARELAKVEGTTLTEAVTHALQAALDEHATRRSTRRRILEGLVASARSAGATPSTDPFSELYDEQGLPR